MQLVYNSSDRLFTRAPLLQYAVVYACGVGLHFSVILSLFCCALFLILAQKKTLLIGITLFAYVIGFWQIPSTTSYQLNEQGSALCQIESIQKQHNRRTYYKIRGRLLNFDKQRKTPAPSCFFQLPFPPKTKIIRCEATLLQIKPNALFLKATQAKCIDKKGSSLAYRRFLWKEKLMHFLKKLSKQSAHFLSALFAGTAVDSFLSFSFAKLGLQHILAISGFHFGLLLTFILFFCKRARFTIWLEPLLFLLATSYLLFLGNLPSVVRAYLMAALALGGSYLGKPSYPINNLGAAALIQLVCNPLSLYHLGFQLSYLCCFAILVIFPVIHAKINSYLHIYKLQASPHCIPYEHKLFTYLKDGLLLGLSIQLYIGPLLLYFFHKLSFSALWYNLIIAPLVALIMIGTLCAFLLFPFNWLYILLDKVTKAILHIIYYAPPSLECTIYTMKEPPLFLILFYLGTVSLTFLYQLEELQKDNQEYFRAIFL